MTFIIFWCKISTLSLDSVEEEEGAEPDNIDVCYQMVLLPWGWTQAKPDNYDDIYSLAMAGVEALTAVHGTK